MELDGDTRITAKVIAYTRSSWDNLEILDLESLRFADLTDEEKSTVNSLGMNANVWDCFVNHYNGYYWDELPGGVRSHFNVLGYGRSSWDDGINVPETEDMYWDELSTSQQEAAYKLCYFKNSWNWISLAEWEI